MLFHVDIAVTKNKFTTGTALAEGLSKCPKQGLTLESTCVPSKVSHTSLHGPTQGFTPEPTGPTQGLTTEPAVPRQGITPEPVVPQARTPIQVLGKDSHPSLEVIGKDPPQARMV